jgi:UDP-N-acetylglucosamine diphosphorylase / glucose-1-phosphate thymidylyltransferase / UDP-N-acetylgalactosamine diphosphorylase / glucosamine-1-phosphate N-acetyltransferase / galactosamine-1-phosphate N-acetyltransferase
MDKQVTALILAGGSGKRFWPLTTDKILFPFMHKPFISHTYLHRLPEAITRIIVIANPQNESYFRSLSFPVPYTVVVQSESKGMADAILHASDSITDNPLLILNGDDIFDHSVMQEVIATASNSDAFGVIAGWKVPHHMPLGYLKLDGDRITGIVEKPDPGDEPSEYAYFVVNYFANGNALVRTLRETTSQKDDVYEQALSTLSQSEKFVMFEHAGFFSSIKYPWNILPIMDHILGTVPSYRGENVTIKSGVTIEGNVYIGDNVRIFEHSKITGPCYIGDGSIIGNNNIIRGSHLGDGCITGFNTDITRSYIGDSCWFHSNYIGDSVLESNISMGSGSVLANLRLDEQDIHSFVGEQKINSRRDKLGSIVGKSVRIGVNVSVMPGIKIGSGSFVGAGIVLDKDIPDASFALLKQEYAVVPNTRRIDAKNRDHFKKAI